MEWVETTGRTVAEALDAALDQLGVDEEETEYQVLEEPQKGLFGRLRVEARVRARVRPVRPRPKAERRDRRRRGDRPGQGRSDRGSGRGRQRSGSSRSSSGNRGNGETSGAAPEAARRTSEGPGDGRNGARTRTTTQPAGQSTEAGQGGAKRRRRRGGRGGRAGEAKQQGAVVANDSSQVTEEARPALDLEAQRAAVEEFLRGLVEAFGRPEAKVSVVAVDEDTLEADVSGDELGLLVGPKGLTLQSVHELVRSMVQRRFVGQSHARIRVDVAGYRERRKQALERFTRSLAEEVVASGRPKQLDPMVASDRKVIHDVVNELDGVVTVSQGEEPARRVIIRPA